MAIAEAVAEGLFNKIKDWAVFNVSFLSFVVTNEHYNSIMTPGNIYEQVRGGLSPLAATCLCPPGTSHECLCTKNYDDTRAVAQKLLQKYLQAKTQHFAELYNDARIWVFNQYFQDTFQEYQRRKRAYIENGIPGIISLIEKICRDEQQAFDWDEEQYNKRLEASISEYLPKAIEDFIKQQDKEFMDQYNKFIDDMNVYARLETLVEVGDLPPESDCSCTPKEDDKPPVSPDAPPLSKGFHLQCQSDHPGPGR